MYKYRIFGINVSSDIELYECEPIGNDETTQVDIRYNELTEFCYEIKSAEENLKHEQGDNVKIPNIYYKADGNEEYSWVKDTAFFKITGQNLLEYRPIADSEGTVFHQWLLCLGFMIIMIHRHVPVLHGAGLLVPRTDNAVVICGESGSGKSTTSDALLKRGLKFISDDSVGVYIEDGNALIKGSFRQRRICTDIVERDRIDVSNARRFEQYGRKKWVIDMSESYCGNVPHQFTKLFCIKLVEGEDITVNEISGIEKLKYVTDCLYRRYYYRQQGDDSKLMGTLLATVGQVKVYVIGRPVKGDTIEEIADTIYKLAILE